MRKTLIAAVLAALVVLPAGLASAADEIRPHPGGLIQAEWLKGRPVVNADNKDMGKIEEVWFDPKDGRVKELIVSIGGFLGIGDKQKVVDYKDARIAWENQKLVVRMDENALRQARRYEGPQPAASPR
jgi:sporulation protein YlmC with PRC-barrel domain